MGSRVEGHEWEGRNRASNVQQRQHPPGLGIYSHVCNGRRQDDGNTGIDGLAAAFPAQIQHRHLLPVSGSPSVNIIITIDDDDAQTPFNLPHPAPSTDPTKLQGQMTSYTRPRTLALSDNAYQCTELIWKTRGFTFEDIVNLSPKFRKIHNDPIVCHDGPSATIMTIHLNLGVGTVGTYAADRSKLQAFYKDMMDCKITGQFLLTEVRHGLVATSVETTATLQSDGTFINSPNRAASKDMPPTVPILGKLCYTVV